MTKKTKPKQPKAPEVKRSVGQPSKYRPEFCEALIKHMESGLSYESFAAEVKIDMPDGTFKKGVNRDTLYEWEKIYPDWKAAKEIGWAKNLLFYEKMGIGIMAGKIPKANVTAWIFNLKNRHRWRDQVQPEPDQKDKEAQSALAEALAALDENQNAPKQDKKPKK